MITKPNLPPLLPNPKTPQIAPVKRMTTAEMQLRREKGLCYTCDEKFSLSHKCPNKHYYVLQLDDGEPEITEPDSPEAKEETTETPTEHHLSFNALSGETAAGTIRFTGSIAGQRVQVLLDGGSSDTFIQPRLVKSLRLPVEAVSPFRVLVGNGHYLHGDSKIRELEMDIQGNPIRVTAHVLPVTGSDIVLGATWLATLGPHIADYSTDTIKFYMAGRFVTLVGEQAQGAQIAEYQHLKRIVTTNSVAELYTIGWANSNHGPETLSTKLPAETPADLAQLLQTYAQVFETPRGLPPQRIYDHRILLPANTPPVKVRPYRYAFAKKDSIEEIVKQMLEEGIIRPSSSPFSAPVILVKKKDGTWRFCTDYRALNAVTIKDSFPIPTVDELLDELHGAVYYSKLDLRSGYHQILVHPEDCHKTAFRTHQGHYEWLVMPFGLTNAPATFQALMNFVFQPFLRKFVLVFFDNILVYSADWSSHLSHLTQVLEVLKEHSLYAKLTKCLFGQKKIEYLGHVVSQAGVEMDPSKLTAIMDWALPTNLKQLRGFLGLTGYYRRFIKNYSIIAGPLTDLLKKDAFHWSDVATEAFNALKKCVTSAPVLTLPDFTKTFYIDTDASGVGIGAVLSQDNHPIAYFSKKISDRMQKRSAYAREMLAITEVVAKFRHYLFGHYFVIRTDQKSLHHLTDQTIQTPDQEEWLPKLMGFRFTIEYKSGKANVVADALTRSFNMAMSSPVFHILGEIKTEVLKDKELAEVYAKCSAQPTALFPYSIRDGTLCWKGRVVVRPQATTLQQKLLMEFHASLVGGHAGINRTFSRIATYFHWPSMRKDVQDFVQNCLVCQRAKHSQLHPAGLLQPLPILQRIWEDVSMYFITGLPNSHGFQVIMVVVDRLSKYAHFAALKSGFTSLQVAEKFFETVVKLHGLPSTIVSDRDKVFTSSFWRHLFKLQGTTLLMSSAYHPQTDGQSEAVNKCLEMYLRCLVYENPKLWYRHLGWAEY